MTPTAFLMARRAASWVTVLLFLLWIMPLGVFFSLEQEEVSCHGRRAICLCRHLIQKAAEQTAAPEMLRALEHARAETERSPSAAPKFLTVKSHQSGPGAATFHQKHAVQPLTGIFLDIPEPVPKPQPA